MNTILKSIGVTAATLICCWDAAVILGANPAKAYGRVCWVEVSQLIQPGCRFVRMTMDGRTVQVCCE